MRLFVKTVAATLALSSNFAESHLYRKPGKLFGGGPVTNTFSDLGSDYAGEKQVEFFVGGDGQRVTHVGISHPNPIPPQFHGVSEGDDDRKEFGDDEYIDHIICDSNGLVINYLYMSTNKGNSVAGGKRPDKIIDDMKDAAPPAHILGGFAGTGDNGGLTSLQAIWICKEDTPCPA